MRYGGIYLYILHSFIGDVVMLFLPIRTRKARCSLLSKFDLYSCFTSSTSYHLYPLTLFIPVCQITNIC